MRVQVGKPAPAFDAIAYVRGESAPVRLSLRQCHGRWVVLFFYPRDFTFVCPTELQAFAGLEAEFTRESALVLAASTDSYHSHKAWFESDTRLRGVAYPVIADSSHRLARAFGVLVEEEGMALRGTFIIDPDRVIRHVQINDLDVGRNVDEILRTLRALRTGAVCPVGWEPGRPTLSGALPADEALAA